MTGNASSRAVCFRAVAVVAVLAFAAIPALAQVSGSIKGTVKDTSGALVPDAAITIKHIETGLVRSTTTDPGGSYLVAALPIGQYEVTVEKTGFKQTIRQGLSLVVGQQLVLDVALEVGTVEQQVTITAEAPLVNTTLSSTSGLVTEQQVKDMPLNGRSFDQLITLNTGVANYSSQSSRSTFTVGGRRPDENRFTINGVEYVGTDTVGLYVIPGGSSGQLLGVDAVREFNVQSETYGAEYGKKAGGQISIVTTGGTNELHGSAFEFLRNNALDARNFFDTGKTPPPFRRNQFGGSLGGPLKRDKLFLFGNYEGFRQRLGSSGQAVVPDLDARRGFLPIGPADANGRPTVIQVPNLKPGMLPFFNLWREPNGQNLGGGTALAIYNPVNKIREDFGLARVDYNISSSDSLSASYLNDNGETVSTNAATNFQSLPILKAQLYTLQETRIFSPTVLNVATLGVGRAYAQTSSVPTIPFPANLSIVAGYPPGGIRIGGGLVSGATTVAAVGGTPPQYNGRTHFSVGDDVHLTRGNHSLSFGVWVERLHENIASQPAAAGGTVNYTTLLTMLQDTPTALSAVLNPVSLGYRMTEVAWYIQDEIKLKPNLTMRIGLRDEMTTGFNEVSCRASNYAFDQSGDIQTEPFVGCSALTQNRALSLWQPRLGLAWDPKGTGTWSVRAGFSITNDLQDMIAFRLSNPPFNSLATFTGPLLSNIPLPPTQPPPTCNFERRSNNIPCSVFSPGGLEPNFYTPTIQQWSLSIERQLSTNMVFRIGYVGSEAFHMMTGLNANQHRPLVCTNAAGCASGGVGTARGVAPAGKTYLAPAASLPNPYVGSTYSFFYEGTSSYHGLNLSLVKRLSGGLSFKVNHTFSKAIDTASTPSISTGSNGLATAYDRFNIKLNRALANYTIRNQFNANFSYELPFGSGRAWGSGATGVANHLISGWQFNGILTIQGGFPFTSQIGRNNTGTGDTRNPDSPDRNPAFTGKGILEDPNQWYDPRQFSVPIPGTFGDAGRGSLIGPGLTNVDMSLFKSISLTERWKMQFRAEAFNVFNHANFGNPGLIVFSGNNYNPSAGRVSATANHSRELQFALHLTF